MSPKLQPVRGTHDILPDEFEKFHEVIEYARQLATLYGFEEMATPIFEPTEVFSRSMGETSDVVSKEMFTFYTKGEESVTLRPEFTAGIVRAFLSNGMQQDLPLKLFSTGPLFRYERPQKGRQRQFHQVNFEWLGDASPEADVELITLAGHLLYVFSGGNKNRCTLLINTLGDMESRSKYRNALVNYLTPYTKDLSEDSQRRLTVNPLRILDSKSPQDKKIVEGAPQITHYLNKENLDRFNSIHEALAQKNFPFFQDVKITPSLVRGLDYYTDTVFEFVDNTGELGAQNTLLAGGRYDGLVEQMGGKSTPAIGFAAGVERLLLSMRQLHLNKKDINVVVLPFEEIIPSAVHQITAMLRNSFFCLKDTTGTKKEIAVEILWNGKLGKRLERANMQKATHALIIAPEEYNQGQIIIRSMETRAEQKILVNDLRDPNKLNAVFQVITK